MKTNRKEISIDELTSGHEKFIERKEENSNGKALFDKTLKKAAKPRKTK